MGSYWRWVAHALRHRDRVASGFALGLAYAHEGDMTVLRAMLRAHGTS
ncbi:MAG: hypothetical protein H0X64_06450 [Gemmatimonadaceae bacterium]|nr:hypothetical protein [Gemmatimonadaceae bacterium]